MFKVCMYVVFEKFLHRFIFLFRRWLQMVSFKDDVCYQTFFFFRLRFMKRANFCRNHTGTAFHMSFEISSLISCRVSPAGIIAG